MKSFKEIKEHGRIIVLKDGVDGFKGEIHMPRWTGTIIASNGAGWNYVSVAPYKLGRYVHDKGHMLWRGRMGCAVSSGKSRVC